jgi:hypothetical protein
MKITITVSKTSFGQGEYLQIMSPAGIPINIVLVVDEVEIIDQREKKRTSQARA